MDTIIDILRDGLPGLQALYVFGSRVQGRATPESDWDVAFLISVDNRVDPVARWKLQEKLAAALNADVDLVDLRLASDVIRFEIVSTGIRIFCENVDSCAEFESSACRRPAGTASICLPATTCYPTTWPLP